MKIITRLLSVVPVVLCAFGLCTNAYAQGAVQASIAGVVRDTSGAVLPGVTIEASSPVLIEKSRNVVSDDTGRYRIIALNPGAYTVTFTLSGFNIVKREAIELTGSLTATIDVEMRVGSLEETLTVTGESPIVDVQSIKQQRVIDDEAIHAIPGQRSYHNLVVLVPGLSVGNTPSGGRLRVGRRPGAPAVLRARVRPELHGHGGADARGARVVLLRAAALRPLVGPTRRGMAAAGRHRAGGRRDRARCRRTDVRPRARARVPRRDRDRRLPPGGGQVRRVRERPEARLGHVVLQHRRQHRVCARPDRRDAPRALARPHRRARGDAPGRAHRGGAPARAPGAPAARPAARRALRGGGRGRRSGDDPAGRGDRAPQRRLVRAADIRPALGRLERGHRGARGTASSR